MSILTGSIQLRQDTAANLTANNPVLLSIEICYETDTKRSKTGDGVTHWNNLQYDDEKATSALVLKDQDGHTWKLRVDTTGSLYTTFIV